MKGSPNPRLPRSLTESRRSAIDKAEARKLFSRDHWLAGLAAMGKAEARDLGLEGGALYDPEVNYRRVKGELWDWADDPAPQQVANDTRAVPAANAQVPEGPPSLSPQ